MPNETGCVDARKEGRCGGESVLLACTMRARLRGLLGRSDQRGILMLAPCHDVHTFGMRRPLDIAFISAEGAVLEAHRNVPPCKRLRCRHAIAVLERFADDASPWFEQGGRFELQMPQATG